MTVTFEDGMVNVVLALDAFAKTTPLEVDTCQKPFPQGTHSP